MLDLDRPRGVGGILADGLRVYFDNFGAFLAIGAAIAVPAELIVPGLIGGRVFASYEPDAPLSAGASVPTNIVFGLYVGPAVWIACTAALTALAEGRTVSIKETVRSGAGLVGGTFGPVLAAGLAASLALFALILPAVYLSVRWYFTVQAVAVERAHGLDALRRSSALVKGRWWRTFGCVLLVSLVSVVPVALFAALGQLAGRETGYEAAALAGDALGDVVLYPLSGVLAGILFFDLRARSRGGDATPSPDGGAA